MALGATSSRVEKCLYSFDKKNKAEEIISCQFLKLINVYCRSQSVLLPKWCVINMHVCACVSVWMTYY